MILVIGNLTNWERDGRPVPSVDGFRFANFRDLDTRVLRDATPDVVFSALVCESFDAVDVARRLAELGYVGSYRALTGALPNTDAVLEEVRNVAPAIDFDLLVLNRTHVPAE